ncbi:MAG: response regulator [Rhodospirillales bacterium]|nr:response regulator [Rhodospirillales bacterium]
MGDDGYPRFDRFSPAQKVLVADRDPLFARILASRLEKMGHKIHCEDSGAAALAWYRAEDVRIVILDFDLMDMDGLELVRAIRAIKRPHYTYVLFYSSRNDKESLTEALSAGADDIMHKPYNALELRLRLDLARRLLDMDDELYHGGGIDKATGVINRKALEQILPRMLALSKRAKFAGTLLFVRLENLKEVFQRHGYETAHRLMTETARLLIACHRGSDLMAKSAEDEFCILLNTTAEDQCVHLAARMTEEAENIAIAAPAREGDPSELVAPRLNFECLPFPPEADKDAPYLLDQAQRTPLTAKIKAA